MEVNQRLEAVFLAAVEHPVDGPLLVDFAVIRKEILQKVVADDLTAGVALVAQCLCNERKVFFQRVSTIHHPDKLHDTVHKVVFAKVFLIAQGQHIIRYRLEGHIFAVIPFAAGIHQSIHIQRVPPEQAPHCIGEQALDLTGQVGAAHGHVLVFHFRGQLILQTVNINKDAVQFFLIGLELLETLLTFFLPCGKFIAYQFSHFIIPSLSGSNYYPAGCKSVLILRQV